MTANPRPIDPKDVDTSPNDAETEAEIQRQIAEDPDTWEARGVIGRRRAIEGRRERQDVTVSLDGDLIAALKALDPHDWQGRLNAIARSSLGM